MKCPTCGKESKNLRVCPFCFTPYPTEDGQKRASQSGPVKRVSGEVGRDLAGQAKAAVDRVKAFVMKQTPVVRWTGLGILVVILLWAFTTSGDDGLEPGVAYSNVIASPMERQEAESIIRQTRESALVDIQNDEVFVSYPAATFPVRDEGQLALAQQFARADEIVEGRKRRIFFYNPNGKLFAQADLQKGVVLTQ